ncbi:MAG: L-fucose isomerase [Bacteroidales bacterium]|nr:L-fucose isomerase [Bacteroidales bacterium]
MSTSDTQTARNFPSSFPKIGIRPVIDGRRDGVRESLEEQTMQMAQTAARFLSSHLRYPDGEPAECVIADTCIGGVAEAARTADTFKRSGVGLTLTVTPCWCYGSETIDMDPLYPKAIWGFNGTERPGAVYLAAALAGHNQTGIPAFGIYGKNVQDAGDGSIHPDVQEKLLRFAGAGLAVTIMQGRSYLSMGSVSMGIAGSMVSEDFFQSWLGMRNEYTDMTEFFRRIDQGIFDPAEFGSAMRWVKKNCREGADFNPPSRQHSRQRKDATWEFVVKMAMIARDLMKGNPRLAEMGFIEESLGHNAILGGFQGQRQWTDHFPNGDFLEAILNSSFDWNGIRQPILVATENDSLNGVAMLFGHLLTHTAQIFADVRTYWSPDAVKRVIGVEPTGLAGNGFIHLLNSGAATLDGTGRQTVSGEPAMKPFWEISEAEVHACLEATTWYPATTEYFRGGGYSSGYLSKGGMPLTMSRINLVKGLGPVLQLAEGWSIDLPEKVHHKLNERTDRTWPTTWFAPRLTGQGAFTDVYTVMANWGANHGAVSYGHIGADLVTLASMLRIPVCMHNIPDQKIFRPGMWNAFGMDKEGQDYRACKTLGALYR